MNTGKTRVNRTLLNEAARSVDRELESRRALNSGLQQVIAFTGVLLAAAFAFGARAGKVNVGCGAQTLLTIFFIGAVAGLLAALLVALHGLGPQGRTLPNPAVFRFYASEGVGKNEIRSDLFEIEIAALEDLGAGNELRARCQRHALRILVLPLIFSAAGAITLFFSSNG